MTGEADGRASSEVLTATGTDDHRPVDEVITSSRIQTLLSQAVDMSTPSSRRPHPGSLTDVQADLTRLGVTPGMLVIIASSNSVELLALYFSILLHGAVPLVVSPACSATRLVELSHHLGAGVLIAARPRRLVGVSVCRSAQVGALYGMALASGDGKRNAVAPHPTQTSTTYAAGEALMLTSGTSGMFSACVHAVSSLQRNARRHAEAVGLRADDAVLVTLPMHYSFAMVAQVFAALVTGARLVLAGPPFSPLSYHAALVEHEITSSSITPTLVRLLLERRIRLPRNLRMLTVGGDRLPATTVGALLRRHPGGELYLTYGLTEAGPRVATLAAHDEPPRLHASVGRPLPGVGIGVRTGGTVAGSGVGELVVHTDTALLRAAGAAAPGARQALLAPGVVATGDLFEVDDSGYLWFRGRTSDVAVVDGEKVSLSSVREAVQSVPGVVRCLPQLRPEDGGTTVLDVIVDVSSETGPSERVLRRALGSLLLPAERPRNITVRPVDRIDFHK